MHYFLDSVESLLQAPMPQRPDEHMWHSRAVETIASARTFAVADMQAAGIEILNALPLAELEQLLKQASTTVEPIKHIRKLLMIGRDSILLATPPPYPDEMEPYFNLSRSLGWVADCAGDEQVAEHALSLLEKLPNITNNGGFEPVYHVDIYKQRLESLLHSNMLLTRHENHSGQEVFHEARKNFRRVVHTSIAAQVLYEHIDVAFISTGKRLNQLYGEFHDTLVEQPVESIAAR